jgi:hypothetical protein
VKSMDCLVSGAALPDRFFFFFYGSVLNSYRSVNKATIKSRVDKDNYILRFVKYY